ncbi:MAG: MFS transporter [Deltaproteobacteria bacterium]|nr:MFS transporter [Deltaproteobacteria bacterium]
MNSRNENKKVSEKSQFGLLTVKRFAPFFWTQFFGAFNDNVFKNGLVIFIAFQTTQAMAEKSHLLINVAAGMLILPFFLFSSLAGQIADKYEKGLLIRYVKIVEIIIMCLVAAAFILNSLFALLLLMFMMGTQSTFFGPLKYSIIPQHLTPGEVVGGNAMVEMGTFVSILLGTIAGGILIQLNHGTYWIACALVLFALCGYLFSRFIPQAGPAAPELKINWNLAAETWNIVKLAGKNRSVFLSILGISWFWFLGVSYLTQLPKFTKDFLHAGESVVTLLLALFSVGVGIGSLLCERLSGKKVELGLVPLGSLGLSVFGIDLFFAYHLPAATHLMGIREFIFVPGAIRVLADFVLIGLFGGFYIVPLYAMVQIRTSTAVRSRIIAANNILNALFMVLATVLAIFTSSILKLSIPQLFLLIAVGNIGVAIYIYTLVPEFSMRFVVWLLSHTMYRVKHHDLLQIPDEGSAVLVCNHVSYVDSLIIAGACRRPIRFVMHRSYYRLPVMNFIFRTAKTIPIESGLKNPAVCKEAFRQIAQALRAGELVCIFPEGCLTKTGEMTRFKSGIERIVSETPVPVIPLALKGLWGSFFSHKNGRAMKCLPRRFWSKVEIAAAAPVEPAQVKADYLFDIVAELRGENA